MALMLFVSLMMGMTAAVSIRRWRRGGWM